MTSFPSTVRYREKNAGSHRTCVIVILVLASLSLVKSTYGQTTTPTIELKPVYAGEEFAFPLTDFTRGGVGRKQYALDGNVPRGIRLVDESVKNQDGSETRVVMLKGTPTTPSQRPYEFSVIVTDSSDNHVVLKFSMPILPFGVNPGAASDLIAQIRPPKLEQCARPQPSQFVMTVSTSDEETVALTENLIETYSNFLNPATLQITNIDQLIANTVGTDSTSEFRPGDYVVIHVIKWKALKDEKSDPEKELWALFEKVNGAPTQWVAHLDPKDNEKRTFDNRIYGSRRVIALAIHINTPAKWDVKYKVTINQKVPQPISNLMQLAALIGGGPEALCEQPKTKDIWGARLMRFKYLASDMIVKVNTITSDPLTGQQVEQSKEYSKAYDNEGRYHWDVSIGMPVKSVKELEFTVESNGANTVVSSKKKERQNAYAFLNIFPVAVDLKSDHFLSTPHFLIGVPITGKPLDRPMVGVGTGIHKDMFKFNFFAGLVFNRVREPRTLQVGDTSTPFQLESDMRTRRVTKFIFGVNFPLREILSSLGSKK